MSGTERLLPPAAAKVWRLRSKIARAALIATDMTCVALGVALSMVMRLGTVDLEPHVLLAAALAVLSAAVLFPQFGLYNRLWRYASIADLAAIVRASVAITVVLALATLLLPALAELPRSVPFINLFVLTALLSATRLAFRFSEVAKPRAARGTATVPVLLVGHENSIDLYLRAIRSQPQRVHRPVGCLVAGRSEGLRLHAVPVLGAPENFRAVYDQLARLGNAPRHVILTERPVVTSNGIVERLTGEAERLGVGVFRVASPTELHKADEARTVALRPIELTDLLERPQHALDRSLVDGFVAGRRVLVTGAGGSIGSELTRQLAAFRPALLVVTDASEYNLYAIDLDLREKFPDTPRETLLCNVRDPGRVNEICDRFKPEIIFHAAALKHVPMVEANPCEGVLTNVVGTRNVVRAAIRCGAAAMVQVSTDKVVNPTSVMGATKRIAELYCQSQDLAGARRGGATRFMTVRFGNVLGSSGSLIPLFQRQLERGGPLTVTDPRMTRFFMTIREAVELTLQASAAGMSCGAGEGKVYVLEMGEPVKIIDIARRMIRLAGFEPDRDIKIEIVGPRPGEKLFEELFDSTEQRFGSDLPGVMAAVPQPIPLLALERAMGELEAWARVGDNDSVVRTIAAMLPTYAPPRPAQGGPAPRRAAERAPLPLAAE